MNDLEQEVAKMAEQAVQASRTRGGALLDFSERSLETVEEILAEAAEFSAEMTARGAENITQYFGCYILEVGRKSFGGTYQWFEKRDQPVLIVGEPEFHVAIISWDKVRSRLAGDPEDNIPFFFAGFAERVRSAKPGDRVLYV